METSKPGFAALNKRDHDAEKRQAGGKIRRAVDGINDPHRLVARHAIENGRVGRRGLLADNQGAGQKIVQPAGQGGLGGFVGDRHHVARGFVAHVTCGQLPVAGHNVGGRRLGNDGGKSVEVDHDGLIGAWAADATAYWIIVTGSAKMWRPQQRCFPSMPVIDPSRKDLVAEFMARPVGPHSGDLRRLLNAMRTDPGLPPYTLVCVEPFRKWRLARKDGGRATPVELIDDTEFDDPLEAERAVFRLRWKTLTGEDLAP